MPRFGFVGPSYQSKSVNADAQRTVNWYLETNEVGKGKSTQSMYSRGGLKVFVELPGEADVPQMFTQNGRAFAAGLGFWELFKNGTAIRRGSLNPVRSGPVFVTANQNQVLACSNGALFLFDLATNIVTPVNMAQFNGPIVSAGFSSSFFIAFQRDSQNFYLSNPLDGATWSGLNASQVEEFTDNIVSMGVSHGELWLHGSKASLPHFNSGALNSPFVPISGAFVEQGSAALAGVSNMDNALFWLGQNADGRLIAWRSNPYTPLRVSTHAVESAWAKYGKVSDAVAFTLQEEGHSFWCVYFPTASATWVYDASERMWVEWDFFDPQAGRIAFRGQCHCFAFDKHLVGDWLTGTVYEYSRDFLDDFGVEIHRMRRAPHLSQEQAFSFHRELIADMEAGTGPVPPLQGLEPPTAYTMTDPLGALWTLKVDDFGLLLTSLGSVYQSSAALYLTSLDRSSTWLVGLDQFGNLTTTQAILAPDGRNRLEFVSSSGQLKWTLEVDQFGNLETVSDGYVARGPYVWLRWSDDGGHTWSNYHKKDCGQAGKYKTRIVWRRLGRSRDRVYELTCSDPVKWAVIDAYLEATPK